MEERDLVIIGGGAGGLVVASVAAQLGLNVTLIEKAPVLGGECLHYGCVPSKALIAAARLASAMRNAGDFGLQSFDGEVDLAKVNDHVKRVIAQIQEHDDPERFRSYGCEVLFGHCEFISDREIQFEGKSIRARRFLIATGSSPRIAKIAGIDTIDYDTNETIFSLRQLPKRLAVLGAGAVGVELAQAFSLLGSEVVIIEQSGRILPLEDGEIAGELAVHLESRGIEIFTSRVVKQLAPGDSGIRIECNDGVVVEADRLLVATGRRPNVEGLGLERAGVQLAAAGIKVDRRQRTSNHRIYACGDVCGPYQFTHAAEYQAGIVISNAIFRVPKKTDYNVLPRVIFTDPEFAHVGRTEREAEECGIKFDVLRYSFSNVDRAMTDLNRTGSIKLLVSKGKLVGATIFGMHAGELIHELALAMKAGLGIGEITGTIHAYPAVSQVHRRVINTWYGKRLFSSASKRYVRWINRIFP